ncbi:Long-Chain Acyl-CoA Synthetase [Klebsormidium nitens]|uniref:Long-Chain Acyl-CoA Synthetase n=1 Tax=Klebsormidium nitens TaxID=105231 RepID=A0A1Y1HWA1_KLENI|nr:Long-Chain Acyl-CoA Synthetase [Klebsormidium nitens]|eukprot:GAQ82914.1 Long-Chain Acyl-CoA Synthetase [Klebsormidium nitens]
MAAKQQILDHVHALDHITDEHARARRQRRLKFAKIQIGGFTLDFGAPLFRDQSIDAPISQTEIVEVPEEAPLAATIVRQENVKGRQTKKKLGVRKAVGIGLWSAAAVSLFQHSALRAAECLTGNGDAVLASDAVILALAFETCPFQNVRNLGGSRNTAIGALLAAAAIGAVSAHARKKRLKKVANQSVRQGQDPIWRSALCPDGQLVATAVPSVDTLYDNFFNYAARKHAQEPCLGRRTADGYSWTSYKDVAEEASAFGRGLRALGLQPKSKLGIYSVNKVEWIVAELGAYAHSIIVVALYSTLGEDAVAYVVDHSEMTIALASMQALASLLGVLPRVEKLHTIIYLDTEPGDTPTDAQRKTAKDAGVELVAYSAVLDKGRASSLPDVPPAAKDTATIMYTSGTTGNPKGVILSHAAVNANAASAELVQVQQGFPIKAGDRYLCYLPLAHIFERVMVTVMLRYGAAVGVFGGKVDALLDDMAALKPTILAGVPRVFNRVHDKVLSKLASGGKVKKALFQAAMAETSRVRAAGGDPATVPLWNKLVFSKIKAALGGECRLIVSGGAPLSKSTQEFLSNAFGAPAIQGYGLTETCAGGAIAIASDPSGGHVGPPSPSLELKLEDVPEMGYTAGGDVPQGEIVLRGYSIMDGYYKEATMTAEVLDADGWFHTGDIGQINPNGTLNIIDRKKNIFKLAQGEYVAAEKLEIQYQASRFVSQIFVYGDSLQSTLVAVVVPDVGALREWAKTSQPALADAPDEKLAASAEAEKAVLADLKVVAKGPPALKGFEVIRAVHLDPEPFSVDNDLLTPTFKSKRPQLKKKYGDIIEKLYAGMASR